MSLPIPVLVGLIIKNELISINIIQVLGLKINIMLVKCNIMLVRRDLMLVRGEIIRVLGLYGQI